MAVLHVFYTALEWTTFLYGWILSMPLKILYAILKYVCRNLDTNCISKNKKPPKIQQPPDYQALKNQLDNAVHDFRLASKKQKDYRQKNESLETECEELRRKNKELTETNEKLKNYGQKQLEKLQQDDARDREKMREQADEHGRKIQELQDVIEELEKSCSEKNKILEQNEKEIGILASDLKATRDSEDKINVEMQRAQDERKRFNEKIGRLKKTLSDEISKYETIEKENKLLQQQITEVEKHKANATSSLAHLQTEMEDKVKHFKEQIKGLENNLEKQIAKYETMENENSCLKQQISEAEKQRVNAMSSVAQLRGEKEDALRRLSETMSLRIRNNNPNIVDLSDEFRPTKLADAMNELYDNQWTDVFSFLEDDWDSQGKGEFVEKECIQFLLNILMEVYTFCRNKAVADWEDGFRKIFLVKVHDSDIDQELVKKLKDERKKNALALIPIIQKQCFQSLHTATLSDTHALSVQSDKGDFVNYINECARICWLMSVYDPPICLVCEGWRSKERRSESPPETSNGIVNDTNDTISSDATCTENIQSMSIGNEYNQGAQGYLHSEVEFNVENEETKTDEKSGEKHDQGEQIVENKDKNSIFPTRLAEENGWENAEGVLDNTKTGRDTGLCPDDDSKRNDCSDMKAQDIEPLVKVKPRFKKDLYREYTKRGDYIDYIVWPIAYLYQNGPVLNKGVAQGCN